MANEIKTVEELRRVKADNENLKKQLKEMNAMAYHYMQIAAKQEDRIEELEKALLQAVTKLKWGK